MAQRRTHPVVAMLAIDGDTDALLRAFDRASVMDDQLLSPTGCSVRLVCGRAQGITVLDVWESEERLRGFLEDESWLEALALEGIPEPRVTILPVYRSAGSPGGTPGVATATVAWR